MNAWHLHWEGLLESPGTYFLNVCVLLHHAPKVALYGL